MKKEEIKNHSVADFRETYEVVCSRPSYLNRND